MSMPTYGLRTRAAIVLTLIAVLLGTGYMNAHDGEKKEAGSDIPVVRIVSEAPEKTTDTPVTAQVTPDPETLEGLAAQREAMRKEEMAMLDEIIADSKSSAEIVSQAQQQKLELLKRMEMETSLETVLRSSGTFSQVLVCTTASSVTVFVGAQALSQEQLTQILDFSMRETGKNAENIKILARK